jgi:hypothetical protein
MDFSLLGVLGRRNEEIIIAPATKSREKIMNTSTTENATNMMTSRG